jgi:hypothetical protein
MRRRGEAPPPRLLHWLARASESRVNLKCLAPTKNVMSLRCHMAPLYAFAPSEIGRRIVTRSEVERALPRDGEVSDRMRCKAQRAIGHFYTFNGFKLSMSPVQREFNVKVGTS